MCVWGENILSFLAAADKQGQAALLVTCRQTGLLEGPGMLSGYVAPCTIVPLPIMAVQRGVTASIGGGGSSSSRELPSLVQLAGFGV